MTNLTRQTLDAIQWVREYQHDGGTMNYHHLAILELLDALTAANAREAALRDELQAYKDEERRSGSGEWLCDRCRQWQSMNAPNLGIECDMCEACADEVDALGEDA